jgi:hypothetical protein
MYETETARYYEIVSTDVNVLGQGALERYLGISFVGMESLL